MENSCEPVADFAVENHGSVVLVRPLNDVGKAWLAEHTDGQWFCGALAVEPRFLFHLIDGMYADGLVQAS